ncbi:MAG: hypothetical protein UZ03_NOB001003553 [Nitrospira sp. OLB3]|nr:MAG: hypothetical protein UZ03_NOB001003553 [Nitrospira sp. OLB3]
MSLVLTRSLAWLLVLPLAGALVGVDSRLSVAASPRPAPVRFVADDYGFTGPDHIPAGLTSIQVVNRGQDLHHVQLLKLLQGKTAGEFQAALKANPGRMPSWIQFVGGPNAAEPGGEAVATMDLGEGEYLLICLIPNRAGVPHLALGMQKTLSVKGADSAPQAAPQAAVTITQADFQFTLSKPVASGSHTIRVMNHGTQPHEAVLVKLTPGVRRKSLPWWRSRGPHRLPASSWVESSALKPAGRPTSRRSSNQAITD